MFLTRDSIQGYIDGYSKAGGQSLQKDIQDWMSNHPVYPLSVQEQSSVMSDLESYRGVVKPVPVQVVPVP